MKEGGRGGGKERKNPLGFKLTSPCFKVSMFGPFLPDAHSKGCD